MKPGLGAFVIMIAFFSFSLPAAGEAAGEPAAASKTEAVRPALPSVPKPSSAPKAGRGPALRKAVAPYYRGRPDSSALLLEGLCLAPAPGGETPEGPGAPIPSSPLPASGPALAGGGVLTRSDSLFCQQYLAMSYALMGQQSRSVGWFRRLMAQDPSFEFPQNEEATVLAAFHSARGLPPPAKKTPPEPAPENRPGPSAREGEAGTAAAAAATESRASLGLYPPMTYGHAALPLGSGWMMRRHPKSGLGLAVLQAGGIALSYYAHLRQERLQNDAFGLTREEEAESRRWRNTQRLSLGLSVGSYLASLLTVPLLGPAKE